jgi:hypothetical protein
MAHTFDHPQPVFRKQKSQKFVIEILTQNAANDKY